MRLFRRRNPQWLREDIRTVGVAAVLTIIACYLVAWYFWHLVGPP